MPLVASIAVMAGRTCNVCLTFPRCVFNNNGKSEQLKTNRATTLSFFACIAFVSTQGLQSHFQDALTALQAFDVLVLVDARVPVANFGYEGGPSQLITQQV